LASAAALAGSVMGSVPRGREIEVGASLGHAVSAHLNDPDKARA